VQENNTLSSANISWESSRESLMTPTVRISRSAPRQQWSRYVWPLIETPISGHAMQQIQPGFRSHCYTTVAQQGTPIRPRKRVDGCRVQDGQRKEHTPLLELPGAQKWTGGARQQQAPWPAGRATALSKTRFSNLRMAWPLGHEHTAAAGAPALVTVLPSRASNGPGRAPTFTISSQTFFHSQL
jgi:hypothetical protein